VEPTTATPFAIAALQRGLAGALLAWARQHSAARVHEWEAYQNSLEEGHQLLEDRCSSVQASEDRPRSLEELGRLFEDLERKWEQNPQEWEKYPPDVNGHYLMLWPGQFYSPLQKRRGVSVPSSMRQVDRSAELQITQGYALMELAARPPASSAPPPTNS
jgi:hypothetical protein